MQKPRDDRHAVAEPAILRVEQSRSDVYVVTILDVSKGGLRVSCSVPMPAGTRVEVRCRGAAVTGEIRYARNVGRDEFHLGVQVLDAPATGRSEEGELDLLRLFHLR